MKIRVNYILDEFSSLPTVKDFPAMITAARSRNIRFNLFVQSKNQLINRYNTEAETIQSNCNNIIFLTSREINLLSEISNLCGTMYDERISKPVVTISELQRLDKHNGEALILSGRFKPFISNLLDIDYFNVNTTEEPYLRKRKTEDSTRISFKVDNEIANINNLANRLNENHLVNENIVNDNESNMKDSTSKRRYYDKSDKYADLISHKVKKST